MSEQHKAPYRRASQDVPDQGPGVPMGRVIPHGAGLRSGELNEVDLDRDLEAARELAEARRTLMAEIGKRIVGQTDVVDHLLIALFARGHCLFVGVPGLAKTLLIQTLA